MRFIKNLYKIYTKFLSNFYEIYIQFISYSAINLLKIEKNHARTFHNFLNFLNWSKNFN